MEDAPIVDGTDVGLVGDVVGLHATSRSADPVSTTIAVDDARI
jgi:hypothetical protein